MPLSTSNEGLTRYKHHGVLLVAVLAFLVSMLVGLTKLIYETRDDRGEVRELLYWSAAQVDREYWRLLDTLDRYASGEATLTRDDLTLRLDILWSRLDIFHGGDVGRRLNAVAGTSEAMAELGRTLRTIEPELAALRHGDARAGAELHGRLAGHAAPIFQMTQRINLSEQALTADFRAQTNRTYWMLTAFLLGIFMTGSILIGLLVGEARRANRMVGLAGAAERRAQESEAKFRDFADASSDWFWEIDENLSFSYISDRFTEISGIPRHALLGKSLEEVGVSNLDRGRTGHRSTLAARRPFRNFVQTQVRPNGHSVHLALSGKPIFDDDGAFHGYRGTGTDVTAHKQAEDALREAHDTLERRVRERTAELEREVADRQRVETALEDQVVALKAAKVAIENQRAEVLTLAQDLAVARDQSEAANRAKSDFLAAMSHELRTPLNAIIGFSEIIGSETFGPVGSVKYREYGRDIHSSGIHLLALISDILDLSKVESGKDKLHDEEIDLDEVAPAVLRLVQQRADSQAVELDLDLPESLPRLWADERKLRQILTNLLTNAIKFTKSGGKVTLRIRCRPETGHVIQVSDTGIGIAIADIPVVLSQFGQVDNMLNRQLDGTGLGLPLTKSWVELHGGSLDLQSEVGVGTIVTVRFPAERIVPLPAARVDASAA